MNLMMRFVLLVFIVAVVTHLVFLVKAIVRKESGLMRHAVGVVLYGLCLAFWRVHVEPSVLGFAVLACYAGVCIYAFFGTIRAFRAA